MLRTTHLPIPIWLVSAGLLAALLAPPTWAKPPIIPQPQINRFALKNGLKVAVIEDHRLPIAALHLRVDAGTIRDPQGLAGLAHLTAQLLTKGAGQRSGAQISEQLEHVGGQATTFAWRDGTDISIRVMSPDMEFALQLLADMVQRPKLPQGQMQLLATAAAMEPTSPARQTDAALAELLFAEHPLGYPRQGSKATLATISRADVVSFFKRYYVASNTQLVIAGDVDSRALEKQVRTHFSSMPAGTAAGLAATPLPAAKEARVLLLQQKGLEQTWFALGHLGISRSSRHYHAALVTNRILGGSDPSSRLKAALSQPKGPCQYIYSRFSALTVTGSFVVRGAAPAEQIGLVLKRTQREIEKMQKNGASSKEVYQAKKHLQLRYPLQLQGLSGIAMQVLKAETYSLGDDYVTAYPERLDQVTTRAVNQAAQTLLVPAALRCAVIGDGAVLETQLQPFGTLQSTKVE